MSCTSRWCIGRSRRWWGRRRCALFRRTDKQGLTREVSEALEACEKLRGQLLAGLSSYEPEALGLVPDPLHGGERSQLLSLLGVLLNGERQAWALPRAPLAEVLPTARLLFGTEAMEYRTPSETRLGAFLGIKEYPTP